MQTAAEQTWPRRLSHETFSAVAPLAGPQSILQIYTSSAPFLRIHALSSLMASPNPPTGPFLTVVTDDKVDPQAAAAAQPPPSYKDTAPAEAPPPPPPGHHHCGHRRRRFRRFGHFLIAAVLLFFAARFIVRHCELRRFAPPHPDDFPWVCLFAKDGTLGGVILTPLFVVFFFVGSSAR